jgi:DNA-binding response OmpR family regulator
MRIAYLEDDADVAMVICAWLREAGFDIVWFDSGVECARAVESERFDACLFDWIVPDLLGTEVLARIQIKLRQSMPPVIFTTGRDSEEDVANVLMAGADDYIVKPISRPILLARLNAVLRRSGLSGSAALPQSFGHLTVDHERRQFLFGDQLLSLTDRETDLALYFFQNIGRILSREHLIKVVWRLVPQVDTRTVDVHASALRRKLMLTPEYGWRLVSVYRHGYRLERQGECN